MLKIFLKKFISISVAAILAVTLVGCFDLGDFEDDTEYYTSFGDVRLVYQNKNVDYKEVETKDYDIKDYFYNKNTGEDFKYGDPKDDEPDEGKDIPQLSYVYMAIPVEQNMEIDSIALYFNAVETCTLEVSFYVVDKLPDGGDFENIRLLGDPEYPQKLDENDSVLEPIIYSDPDKKAWVGSTSVSLIQNRWNAFLMDKWTIIETQIEEGTLIEKETIIEKETLIVKEDYYLLLRFDNNSGVNNSGEIKLTTPVAFRTTNLLIRAFFED